MSKKIVAFEENNTGEYVMGRGDCKLVPVVLQEDYEIMRKSERVWRKEAVAALKYCKELQGALIEEQQKKAVSLEWLWETFDDAKEIMPDAHDKAIITQVKGFFKGKLMIAKKEVEKK